MVVRFAYDSSMRNSVFSWDVTFRGADRRTRPATAVMSTAVFSRSSKGDDDDNDNEQCSGKPDDNLTGSLRHETIRQLLTRFVFFFCLRTVGRSIYIGVRSTPSRDKTNLPVSPGMTGAITNPLPRPETGRHGSRPHPLSLRISFPADDRPGVLSDP